MPASTSGAPARTGWPWAERWDSGRRRSISSRSRSEPGVRHRRAPCVHREASGGRIAWSDTWEGRVMFHIATTHKDTAALDRTSPGWISKLRATPGPVALHWILRVAVAACFIGHGAFGIITKEAWLPYFGIFAIPEAWACPLMPVVGTGNTAMGEIILFHLVLAVLLSMSVCGFVSP